MARITSQATSVEVPPPNGAKLKVEEMGLCVTEDWAATDSLSQLIVGKWEEKESSRKRRYYHITKQGRASLAEKQQAWTDLCIAVNRILDKSHG